MNIIGSVALLVTALLAPVDAPAQLPADVPEIHIVSVEGAAGILG